MKLPIVLLLDLGYLLAAAATLPWFLYRLAFRGDARGFLSRFGIGLGAGTSSSIWLHGASAGEVSLLRALVPLLERDLPETSLVVSTFSSTGLAAARRAFPRHRVIFFPFDLSLIAVRFLRRFRPRLIVMVESELWPNFLIAARRRDVPVAVLNGRMSAKSCRRHARTGIVPSILRDVPLIAVQAEEHAKRLRRLGVAAPQIHVTGNMKYDLAPPPSHPKEIRTLREKLGYEARDVVVIGGSLHPREDDALLFAYRRVARTGTVPSALIIVPRYPADAGRVARRVRGHGYRAVCKTALDGGAHPPGTQGVLVVDTLGELGTLYAAADVAFVGGSLFRRASNKGGHNLMEPAILGLPVLFGPFNLSFEETGRALVGAGGGIMVRDAEELARALPALVDDAEARRKMGGRAREVILGRQGATERNYALIKPLLEAQSARLRAPGFDPTMPRSAGGPESR